MSEHFQPQYDFAKIQGQLREDVTHADDVARNAQVLATLAVAEQLSMLVVVLDNIHQTLKGIEGAAKAK